MFRPGCWKLRNYIESILWWCEEEENKYKACYYFPITREDIEIDMGLVQWAYERDMPVVEILLRLRDKKRKREEGTE